MIIRSQNKKAIININMIDTIEVRGKKVRYFSGGGMETMGVLGEYSTEEKAIKVLDMIAQNYVESEKYIIRRVFEMPQDSEV